MNWSDTVELIGIEKGLDDDGFEANIEGEPRQIFANEKSVRSNEFHAAKQRGVTLSYMFEVRSEEYLGEEKLIYKEQMHKVYRTYKIGEFTELICRRDGDDHGT